MCRPRVAGYMPTDNCKMRLLGEGDHEYVTVVMYGATKVGLCWGMLGGVQWEVRAKVCREMWGVGLISLENNRQRGGAEKRVGKRLQLNGRGVFARVG